jgi:dTDP-4-amino-4,6-dideoxygalactose transaminase
MSSFRIPLVDLHAQYLSIKPEIDDAIARVIAKTAFVLGEEAEKFEAEFAEYCGARRCIACGNGTDALELALKAVGVHAGDEVITVAHTFIATAEAVATIGATPVFVDIRPDTLLMDPSKIEAAITEKTRAIVPVHLYGQMCDMEAITAIAKRHGLKVVEDAAQAHGASYQAKRAGCWGDAASYSFYPGKNLGAYGDAGAVVTNDAQIADWVAQARNHGRMSKYEHKFLGRNSRMDGLQAAVLRSKLVHLEAWNSRRRELAARFAQLIAGMRGVHRPVISPDCVPVFHLFVIHVAGRDRVLKRLLATGIEAGIHYPVPLHLQPAFAGYEIKRGELPISEGAASEILSLPIYPEMTDMMVEEIAAAVAASLGDQG